VKKEIEEAMRKRMWKEIGFCGFGEPTERLDLLLEVARWTKQRYGNVAIRVKTNGHGYVCTPIVMTMVRKVSAALVHAMESASECFEPVLWSRSSCALMS